MADLSFPSSSSSSSFSSSTPPPRSRTLIVYVTLAVLLLLFLSFNSPSKTQHRPNRRLKLRSASSPPAAGHRIPFDPVVSEIEQRREDRKWERSHFDLDHAIAPGHEPQPESEDFADAEDYINDEERFNVTSRIVLLFPKIDVSPPDGAVVADELTEWNVKQAVREILHRAARDMELHDKNKDGMVSFQEYEAPSWARRDDDSTWWKGEHFNASDVDGDGFLNLTEFNDFLHPADSSNPKLIKWLCQEEIRERDKDKDGKLNFQEFFNGLFDSVRSYDDVRNETDTSSDGPAKKLFAELDKDGDGFMSADELLHVIGNLHPTERYYAKQQADYVISQADSNGDGILTLKEMVEHPYVFYSAIFADEDEDYPFHDEFR